MTPGQRRNLERLLAPRHVAVIGGRDAEVVVNECVRIGFQGPLWPVNSKRKEIGGQVCFRRIHDLPEPPDAVFVAIPRDAAIEIVAELNAFGAGGAVCYTAGFGELGAEGETAQNALIEAAGDIALVGPNCYGVINYLDRVALWPFAHGGACPGYGAAIITQSGMFSSDLTMNQRSVPFAYMISAGNQATLGLEDFIETLVQRESVRAIGVHVEGLRDIPRFAEVALRAIQSDVPIVALKTGSSAIGSQLTLSHTGSLSGTDDCYQALFNRLGIIRVHTPAQFLETLKLVCVCGMPKGNRMIGLTCSGGGATMLADYAEKISIEFPSPTPITSERLKEQLPPIATVSNPLDYTTPLWGDAEHLTPVFNTMLADTYDAALLLQDYPLPGLDQSKSSYLTDAKSFIDATRAARIPAVVCSTLPESIDRATRDMLIENGVAPMQGIHETLDALSGAIRYGMRRNQILALNRREKWRIQPVQESDQISSSIDEWRGKEHLKRAGLAVPEGRVVAADEVADGAEAVGFPVVLKHVGNRLLHKSDVGAVVLSLNNRRAVEAAARQIRCNINAHDHNATSDYFLVERMIPSPVAELLVGIRNDAQFGLVMTLASGGIFTELIGDAVTILIPAARQDFTDALSRLKLSRLLDGFRGRPGADRDSILDALGRLSDYMQKHVGIIGEIEINPLFVMADGVYAVDVLMRVVSDDE